MRISFVLSVLLLVGCTQTEVEKQPVEAERFESVSVEPAVIEEAIEAPPVDPVPSGLCQEIVIWSMSEGCAPCKKLADDGYFLPELAELFRCGTRLQETIELVDSMPFAEVRTNEGSLVRAYDIFVSLEIKEERFQHIASTIAQAILKETQGGVGE